MYCIQAQNIVVFFFPPSNNTAWRCPTAHTKFQSIRAFRKHFEYTLAQLMEQERILRTSKSNV